MASLSSSSSPSTTAETVSPWLYFLAGSLVSAVSFWLLLLPIPKNNNKSVNNKNTNDDDDDNDNDEYDDDDVDSLDEPLSNNNNVVTKQCHQWGARDAPYKMVLIVNTSLNMGKGKIAAQCGHASVGAYKRALQRCPNAVKWWERTGCAKIAVKCPTEDELANIYTAARAKDIPMYLVEDAGRTQIAAGSRTVLGLGPAPVHVFEGVTSHLKLM
ncbi:peptidyl-tRNA hydrolase [Nitzschia inconspicua]|uniref:peptidyl-tRNA hydrolase n=1 Tax=Nitzschia inconspicua TaxID=303405 RepID=A0A9K3M3E6_9STRA|nr:peptidyl-tRNA hydrolase [Nitzschia inconspicua]